MTRKLRFRCVEQQSDSSLQTTELRCELSCSLSCPTPLQGARLSSCSSYMEDMHVTKYSGLLFGSLSPSDCSAAVDCWIFLRLCTSWCHTFRFVFSLWQAFLFLPSPLLWLHDDLVFPRTFLKIILYFEIIITSFSLSSLQTLPHILPCSLLNSWPPFHWLLLLAYIGIYIHKYFWI